MMSFHFILKQDQTYFNSMLAAIRKSSKSRQKIIHFEEVQEVEGLKSRPCENYLADFRTSETLTIDACRSEKSARQFHMVSTSEFWEVQKVHEAQEF